jgi:hypothetical protein
MTADYFTKPLQGALFMKFWDKIMNINSKATGSQDCRSVLRKPDKRDPWESQQTDDGRGTEGWNMVHKRRNRNIRNREQMLILK